MDKALEIAVDATRRHSFDALTMDEHRDLVRDAVAAYLAALPATDTSGLLDAVDREMIARGDRLGAAEARKLLAAYDAQASDLEEMREALCPFAALGGQLNERDHRAGMLYRAAYWDCPEDMVVYSDNGACITVGDVRRARSYLEGRK